MPFALLIFGVIFILVGYQGTQSQLFALLKGDFTGSGNFIYWVVSIIIIGAIGYVPKLKSVSDAFLVLILVVLFISHANFFSAFNSQITSATATPGSSPGAGSPTTTPTAPAPVTGSLGVTSTPLTTGQVNVLNNANSLSLFP